MAEINLNTELMKNMEIEEHLSSRNGISVYTVKSTKSNVRYVLKHISIPENQNQVEALLLTGAAADHNAAQAYYEQVVTDYKQELEKLEELSSSVNLGSFRSYEIKPKENEIGFDIYLLSEYRTTLEQHLASKTLSRSDAVQMAIDLCNALCELRAAGLVHRDVKPANIFMEQGHFLLADLGIAQIDGLKYCSMPERMISSFSAPELFELMAVVNETIDIYSVGLILYRIYNGGHAPFEDEKTSAKGADKLRVTGQPLPAPMFADYEVAAIILKACAFHPEDRYQTPEEMKQAFVDYMSRNQIGSDPVTPPIVIEDEPIAQEFAQEDIEPVQFTNTDELDDVFKENFSPDNDMLNALIDSVHTLTDDDQTIDAFADNDTPSSPVPRKRKGFTKWFPTVLLILLVAALAAGAVWFFFIRKDTLTVSGFEIIDRSVDSITISLTTDEDPAKFKVICTDAYGNKSTQDYVPGTTNTFTGLAAGAQYVFSVEGFKEEHVAGAVPHNASTKSTTQILNLSISRQTVSEIELTFIPDGAEPDEWIVSYSPVGQDPATKAFTGHTVVLTGLEPDTQYEITLVDPSDVQLTGQTTVTGATLPSVSLVADGVRAEFINSTATITWEFVGNAPASWNVVTTGSEGYNDTQTVMESKLVLENLKAGESYSIVITCDNMAGSVSTGFTLDAYSIKEITTEVNENGGIDIAWTCAAEQDGTQWLVVYSPVGNEDMAMVEQTDEQSVTLTSLIPGSSYHIEIQEANGEQVGGENTIDIDVPAAESFTEYGFTKGIVVIYPRPEQEDWTVNNLQGNRSSYSATEKIAFACQKQSGTTDSEDTVSTLLVVRASDGSVVDFYTGEAAWKDMWTSDCYVGELLRTPEAPGDYTIELYFNGKRVKTDGDVKFTIKQ